jgi:hypothetical protein
LNGGQLGNGKNLDNPYQKQIPFFEHKKIYEISSGNTYSIACSNSEYYYWGRLSYNSGKNLLSPVSVLFSNNKIYFKEEIQKKNYFIYLILISSILLFIFFMLFTKK